MIARPRRTDPSTFPRAAGDAKPVGYTGNVFIDTYRIDGTLLYRIDLGVNVRAGAHYAQPYTLMHDPQYRVEVARQQTTYNQPAYPSFYLASDTDCAKVPLPGRR